MGNLSSYIFVGKKNKKVELEYQYKNPELNFISSEIKLKLLQIINIKNKLTKTEFRTMEKLEEEQINTDNFNINIFLSSEHQITLSYFYIKYFPFDLIFKKILSKHKNNKINNNKDRTNFENKYLVTDTFDKNYQIQFTVINHEINLQNFYTWIEFIKFMSLYNLNYLLKNKIVNEQNFDLFTIDLISDINNNEIRTFLKQIFKEFNLNISIKKQFINSLNDVTQFNDNCKTLFLGYSEVIIDILLNTMPSKNYTHHKFSIFDSQSKISSQVLTGEFLTPYIDYTLQDVEFYNDYYLDLFNCRTDDLNLLTNKNSNKGLFVKHKKPIVFNINCNKINNNLVKNDRYSSISNVSLTSNSYTVIKKIVFRPFINNKDIFNYTHCTYVDIFFTDGDIQIIGVNNTQEKWTFCSRVEFNWSENDPFATKVNDKSFDPEKLEYEVLMNSNKKIVKIKLVPSELSINFSLGYFVIIK